MRKQIIFGEPSIGKEEINYISKVVRSKWIGSGQVTEKFEKKFKIYKNSKYALSVNSCTAALHLSLIYCGIKRNDEVITTPMTFASTINSIAMVGAKPILADIDPETFNINPKNIEKKITKKTKAILIVHLAGLPCDLNKILKIAKKYKLKIIEDCAQSQGAKYKNQFVGTIGDFGCFSFYPTKILGAYGDGGFITTNSVKMFNTIRRLRFYGIEQNDKKNKFNGLYYSNEHGLNSRLDEIHSSILNIKVKKVKNFIKKRRQLAHSYSKELKDTSLLLPRENINCKHVYHLYTVYHPKRLKIIKALEKKKIKINIYYPYPIHKMKGFFSRKNKNYKLPITNKIYKGIFSLPLYPELKSIHLKHLTICTQNTLRKVTKGKWFVLMLHTRIRGLRDF